MKKTTLISGALSQERRTRRMLELMSAPKQWEMGDGEVSEINTPWTNRARELQVSTHFSRCRSLQEINTYDYAYVVVLRLSCPYVRVIYFPSLPRRR